MFQPLIPPFDKRNRNLYINIAGRLIHRRRARVSPLDAVVQAGDGVWEEMRVREGRVFNLVPHIDRLRQGAETLGYQEIPSRPWLIGQVKRTLLDNDMYDGVHLRMFMTRGIKITAGIGTALNRYGPTLLIIAEFKEPYPVEEGVKLVTGRYRRWPEACVDPSLHHCSMINAVLNRLDAEKAEAHDALMLDLDGHVVDTTTSSLFLVRDGKVLTAPPAPGGEGIARGAVLELCAEEGLKVKEADLKPADLGKADEIFVADPQREVAGVLEIDGETVAGGEVGEITRRLREAYVERALETGTKLLDEPEEYEDEDEDDDEEDEGFDLE